MPSSWVLGPVGHAVPSYPPPLNKPHPQISFKLGLTLGMAVERGVGEEPGQQMFKKKLFSDPLGKSICFFG